MKIDIVSIKNHIVNGDLENGIDLLLREINNTKYEPSGILISAKYQKYKGEINRGIIGEGVGQRAFNKIIFETIELISEIRDDFFINDVLYGQLLLFETPYGQITPVNERVYLDAFVNNKTRCIAWELNMEYPTVKKELGTTLFWYVIKPDKSRSPKYTTSLDLKTAWSSSYKAASWGKDGFGDWELGRYELVVELPGKQSRSSVFTIE